MDFIADIFARGWDNFLARPSGSLNLRFILQPTIATIIAVRAGIKDARAGRPPYLWGAFTNREHRLVFVRRGWEDLRTPFLVAVILDAVYQTITHQAIYLLELLFTATLLALVPYLVLRGPANRIARLFVGGGGEAERTQPAPATPGDK